MFWSCINLCNLWYCRSACHLSTWMGLLLRYSQTTKLFISRRQWSESVMAFRFIECTINGISSMVINMGESKVSCSQVFYEITIGLKRKSVISGWAGWMESFINSCSVTSTASRLGSVSLRITIHKSLLMVLSHCFMLFAWFSAIQESMTYRQYRISGIFREDLIIAELATCLKWPPKKTTHTMENKPY